MRTETKVNTSAAIGLLVSIIGSGADDTKVMLIICGIGILMMIPAAIYHERRRIKDVEETERYAVPAGMGRKYGSPVRPFNLH
jgi:hypothetical protein